MIVEGFTLEVSLSQTKNNDAVLMLSCNDSFFTNNVIPEERQHIAMAMVGHWAGLKWMAVTITLSKRIRS
jgi:hypothetical protein